MWLFLTDEATVMSTQRRGQEGETDAPGLTPALLWVLVVFPARALGLSPPLRDSPHHRRPAPAQPQPLTSPSGPAPQSPPGISLGTPLFNLACSPFGPCVCHQQCPPPAFSLGNLIGFHLRRLSCAGPSSWHSLVMKSIEGTFWEMSLPM